MTHGHKELPGLLMPEASLHRLADDLAARFTGVFTRETVDRYVFESYTALARTAKVPAQLPVLAGRFSTERLTAQMAAALLQHHGSDRVHVRSAGSRPAAGIDAAALGVMAEVGIDITAEFPKPLTDDVVPAADVGSGA